MPPERFELPTPWFEARCSRPLSYDGVTVRVYSHVPDIGHVSDAR
jgi:hypothetical protein